MNNFVDLLSQVGSEVLVNQLVLASHVLVATAVDSLYPVSQKYNNSLFNSWLRMEKPPWSISPGKSQTTAAERVENLSIKTHSHQTTFLS